MVRIIGLALVGLLISGPVLASKEVGCVCNNRAIKTPNCGICGSTAGHMEQTDTGVDCMCSSKMKPIKSHEVSCAETCKDDGGWSGEFES